MVKANGDGAAAGPQLSNEMNDDQRHKLTTDYRKRYEHALDAKKAADKTLKDVGKLIKADLGNSGMRDIKDMIELGTPEGEGRIKEEMEARARVMRWMNVPLNTQTSLFPDVDRRPITEKAFGDGKKAGIAGAAHVNPYHQTNDGHKAWNDGYIAGQDVILAKIKPLDTEGAADSLAS
jgi:ribosome modulation factor